MLLVLDLAMAEGVLVSGWVGVVWGSVVGVVGLELAAHRFDIESKVAPSSHDF